MFVFYRDQIEVAGPVRDHLLLLMHSITALELPLARMSKEESL
jgi:hypothetical protein